MDSMATLEEHSRVVQEEFKCCEPDCPRGFKDQTLEQEVKKSKVDAEDHVFNYGCLHLSLAGYFGMLKILQRKVMEKD